MGIDGREERGTNTVMRVLIVGDMGAIAIAVFLSEAKVDDIDEM